MWHIAQVNVARPQAPMDSAQLADFVALLNPINALADVSPGFVWRLKSESGNATDIVVSGMPGANINLSVWTTVEHLFEYVYRTAHTPAMMRRREWFARPTEAHVALWWVPAGHIPTVEEAVERLAHLQAHGPTPHAFTFKERYPSPAESGPPRDMQPERYCTA